MTIVKSSSNKTNNGDTSSTIPISVSKEEGEGNKSNNTYQWSHLAKCEDGAGHYLGVDKKSGQVFSWGSSNAMGQLGRNNNEDETTKRERRKKKNGERNNSNNNKTMPQIVEGFTGKAYKVYAGGSGESGHSAILDVEGNLWVAGCDRWQQLGLGSSNGGAAGYTWEDGRIWRPFFTRNGFITSLMKEKEHQQQHSMTNTNNNTIIRDVALGGDHTVILSSNRSNVYTFGKGGEGQLGLVGKPFVSAPILSTSLGDKKKDGKKIAAVCAIQHCSLTLDDDGKVMKKAGRCREKTDTFRQALEACVERARKDGLLVNSAS